MKKRRRWFANLLLFGISLAVGGWLGYRLGNFGGEQATPTPIRTIPEAQRPDQRSLLILGVDRVDSTEARLQGVWYVVYRLNQPRLTLIPLYPALQGSNSNPEHELEEAFRLRSDGAVDPSFFSAVQENFSMSWDAYILVDDIAIMEIVDFFGGVTIDGELFSGPRAVGEIPRAWEDPDNAVLGQAYLLESICDDITFESVPKTYEQILSLIPDHMRSEISTDQAFSDWLGLLSSGSPLTCDFPSLRLTPAP